MENWEAAYIAGIIDGEGSITLTKMHSKEHRRPCISIPSNDREMLVYIKHLTGGRIYNKKNYNPLKHQNSYTLYIKRKEEVFRILKEIYLYLRIERKKKRAEWILKYYNIVTPRNGKYNEESLKKNYYLKKVFLNFSKT
ncbi:LAGLIDADG family homing endonuclease [Virgibacillus ndiopensis]|uniref:LAGLIDADG family homing endonuclease n=1 Tax=Virgibacillus ndiopensis TaxID=2004408 RepID=UPI000C07239D|nr:LAGLIDADG family homing endonuclease [Virgibacillus ndiopensis]